MKDTGRGPSVKLAGLLCLASATMITLDVQGGTDSPLEPARTALGEVLGPVDEQVAKLRRPLDAAPGFLKTNQSLRDQVARLEAEKANLQSQLNTTALDRNRAAELQGLLRSGSEVGYTLKAARVVSVGPAQSFGQTVLIDKGEADGVYADMTVLNHDGLVGRVSRATRSTATVVLIVDGESVVGSRLGSSLEIGYLRGRGDLSGDARLDLDLVDNTATPGEGDVVTTWGSRTSAPYVAGIPIGTVESVYASPRQLSKQAVIKPFVDFSSLDVVAVVVNDDTDGVLQDGEIRAGGNR